MDSNKENKNQSNKTSSIRSFEGVCRATGCHNKTKFKPESKPSEMYYCSDGCHIKGWLETGTGPVHPKHPVQRTLRNRSINKTKPTDLYKLPQS